MKHLLSILLFVLVTISMTAQNKEIKGEVVDNANTPIIGANVFINLSSINKKRVD